MVVFFRAIVMLAVLVGLPAAWIYYGPLPSGAQRAVDRAVEVVRNATGWQQPTAERVATKAAPRFSVVADPAPKFSSHSERPQSDLSQSSGCRPEHRHLWREPVRCRPPRGLPSRWSPCSNDCEPWGRRNTPSRHGVERESFFGSAVRCRLPKTSNLRSSLKPWPRPRGLRSSRW